MAIKINSKELRKIEKISFLTGMHRKKSLNIPQKEPELKSNIQEIEPEIELKIELKSNIQEIYFKIFTDGSNTDQAKTFHAKYLRKGGIGIYHPDSNTQISEPFPFENPTNIRAEWWAAIRALQWVLEMTKNLNDNEQKKIKVFLYIDCQNVIDSMTKWVPGWKKKGWKKADGKPVLNKELIVLLDNLISNKLPLTTFIKVKAHQSKPKDKKLLWLWNGNYVADKLADEGRIKAEQL
jgi:ribonuclease HI